MRVSIVTPCYNSAEYLEQCILSVKGQKRCNYEHIIVDGGSTDGTTDIIKKYEGTYPMRWISEKDNGMYDAIAKGFRMADGEIFAWLNSDDMYMPWATYAMERVCRSGEVDWCTGIPAHFNAEGMQHLIERSNDLRYARPLIARGWYDGRRLGWIQQESTFWTRRLYEQVGGIDTHFQYAGDFDLWCRMARHAELHTVNVVIGGFRRHEGQKSSAVEQYRAEQPALSRFHRLLRRFNIYRKVERWHNRNRRTIAIQTLPEI